MRKKQKQNIYWSYSAFFG